MQRKFFTKFILSIFLTQAVITSSSNAAVFYSDYDCSGYYHCPGWYVGEYIGNALAHSKFKTSVDSGTYFTSSANIESVNKNGSKDLDPHEFDGRTMWGIQAGYNCAPRKNFIYGFVTDFGFFNLHGSQEVTAKYPTFDAFYTIKTEIRTDWLWTIRGRLGIELCHGWPFVYGTGGLALSSIRVSNSFFDTAASQGHGFQYSQKCKSWMGCGRWYRISTV